MATIAVDYTPAIRQSAGIGRLVRGQIQALVAANPPFDLRLFVVGRVDEPQRRTAPLPLYTTPLDERTMVRLWHRLNSPIPPVHWFTGGPLALFHATDFVLAPCRARRQVVTVHDLAFLFYPDAAMPGLHRYLNLVVPRSVRRADHLIADSHHTARDLTEQWGVAPEQISVVQGAVDHERFQPLDDKERLGRLRSRLGIGGEPYILALSRLEPRKNLRRLVEAFHLARQAAALPHKLVIGGGKGWLYEEIFATVERLGLSAQVLFPGFVPDEELPTLYAGAEFFAYPSLYEGFGLPIVEALACGTPVLTARNSCLPEAGGPGALYVDAHDVESIATGLLRLATDATLRHCLRQLGLAHAAHFTWARSAAQLRSVYDLMLT